MYESDLPIIVFLAEYIAELDLINGEVKPRLFRYRSKREDWYTSLICFHHVALAVIVLLEM